jgi:hypothetical protein
VKVDPALRTLTFPAVVNAREGLVEYALVAREGKVHESVFSTEVEALHLHLGALLLKWARPEGSGLPLPIEIRVAWETPAGRFWKPMEELIVLAEDSPFGKAGQSLPSGAWQYVGRVAAGGTLAAQADGSIVALIEDESALVWNPRPSRVDDQLHGPNARELPPVGSPVKIEFREAAVQRAERRAR